jgi:DNA-binding CsgD family transcriptional regulator
VAAARGHLEEASSVLEQAVDQHARVSDAFGRARALLALGLVRRRARQKRSAREAIRAALEGFEQFGALGWAEKAGSELGRIGGRTSAEGLTATEQRVARLAADGLSNKQIAVQLYVSIYTVEKHLSHVYEKLGVRSRGELAGRLAALA